MTTPKEIATHYIKLLEKGKTQKIIDLFSKDGMVHSPIYGIKSAKDFYKELKEDTTVSKLTLLGIFEETNSQRVALYFKYEWTLKNDKKVIFNVVDIITFDERFKIKTLEIIYDTIDTRNQVGSLKN